MINIKAKNLVEQHIGQVIISYTFNPTRMLVEPMLIVSFYFLLFIVIIMFSRIMGKSINRESKYRNVSHKLITGDLQNTSDEIPIITHKKND